MAILLLFLLLAALPLISVFVFFEIMAKKQQGEWKDRLQKFAVAIAWITLGILSLLFLYWVCTYGHHRWRNIMLSIYQAMHFLAKL